MRPIRLELKGFTAFRDEQRIDFEGLDLFAVSGQTGSGKSSLLDAMTYALFGYVERVGKQVGQLVSQGQPRMAVKLEFAVGDDRYRVTRSTPSARGATKILLERWDGDWVQAGDGADRVREADAMIERIVGLDYDAFTRSVLLPQGKFQEFLVGDAKDRRKILTELLGLDLFVRLVARAGELKRTAAAQADAKEGLLETEYAGVTEDAVAEAEEVAKDAAARDDSLAASESEVREVAERWAKAEREMRELGSCASDARLAAGAARQVAEAMEELAGQVADAESEVKRTAKAAADAAKAAEKREKARSKAEAEWGRVTDLVALRARVEGLAERRAEVERVEAELAQGLAGRPALERELAAAERKLSKGEGERTRVSKALDAARAAADEALHADHVAAVRAGLHRGDDCPVCGAKVTTLPKAAKSPDVERVRAAVAKSERELEEAGKALREAERARDAATSALEGAAREAQRLGQEVAKRRADAEMLEEELAKAFVGKLPPDPAATLDGRIGKLEELELAETSARESFREAEWAASTSERERDAMLAQVAEARARLEGVSVSGLLDRAKAAGGRDLALPALPAIGVAKKDAAAIAATAGELADGLERLANDLDDVAERRGAGEADLLAEAEEAVGGVIAKTGSLPELVKAVGDARLRAAGELATAERAAADMRARLANASKLMEDIAAQRLRAGRFGALAAELRADRIIAFLQLEALQILAATGSEHLSTLSAGRYRLAYDEDEFFVIDTWNGEERRSARTLSGGETFLASLGLALALSEEVQSLAVTERARLESLFLDEGFGTLDPETLEIVVDAIEQLGGDGRMVGVITHVQELAIRLPARIEVEKSPRGSRLSVVI